MLTNSSNITLHPVDQSICEQAAHLRAKYNWLRTPDALQIASALKHGAQVMVTNDQRWERLTEIQVAILQKLIKS